MIGALVVTLSGDDRSGHGRLLFGFRSSDLYSNIDIIPRSPNLIVDMPETGGAGDPN